jgi:transposase
VRALEFLFRPRSVAVIGAFTLRGLVAELAERGLDVDYRTVWNFVHREGLSFKKGRCHMWTSDNRGWRLIRR